MTDEKIRVMHILPHAAAGGASLAAMELAAALDPARYEACMAVGPDSGGENSALQEMRAKGLDVCVLPHMCRKPNLRCDARALIELTRAIYLHRPHVIHTHGSKSKLLAPIAAAIGRVPVRIAHLWGWEWMPAENAAQSVAFACAARVTATGYDAMIACSEAMREEGLACGIGHPSQYEVALPSVNTRRFSPAGRELTKRQVRAEFGVPPDAPLVISVMRLARQKAPEVLLQAAALLADRVPSLRWLIVGGGPLEAEVRSMVAALDLDGRVTLAGPRWDVERLLKAADVFALASRWEPFGIVYLEAAATGLPVVGTRVDGAVEAVADGETGLMVPPESPKALAAAVERVATDKALARRLGNAGMRRARGFSHEQFVGPVEALYERLLAEKIGWRRNDQASRLSQAAS